MGRMPASKRSSDPFSPPGEEEERTPELADLPRRAPPALETTPAPLAVPERRREVKYKRPGTSWVTFVILGFAAVGMAAVGGSAIRKVLHKDLTVPATKAAARPTTYSTLSKDDAILVTVAVTPRDARLMLDGEPAVSNPLRILRSKHRHKIAAHAHGYTPVIQEFTADASKTIQLKLVKQRP